MIFEFIKSIKILEPNVLLSDFLLAGACLYCYFNIKRKSGRSLAYDFPKYWTLFFLFEGFSFFVGGLAHGLYAYFGDVLHFLGWYASVIGVFCFTWGTMIATFGKANKFISYMMLFAAAASVVSSTIFKAFWIIVIYCFISLFEVIVINMHSKLISFKKQQSKGILVGTLFFMLASAVHILNMSLLGVSSQISSHLLIAVGIVFFGNGCLQTMRKKYDKNSNLNENIAG